MNLSSNWELDALCAFMRTGAPIYYDHITNVAAGWCVSPPPRRPTGASRPPATRGEAGLGRVPSAGGLWNAGENATVCVRVERSESAVTNLSSTSALAGAERFPDRGDKLRADSAYSARREDSEHGSPVRTRPAIPDAARPDTHTHASTLTHTLTQAQAAAVSATSPRPAGSAPPPPPHIQPPQRPPPRTLSGRVASANKLSVVTEFGRPPSPVEAVAAQTLARGVASGAASGATAAGADVGVSAVAAQAQASDVAVGDASARTAAAADAGVRAVDSFPGEPSAVQAAPASASAGDATATGMHGAVAGLVEEQSAPTLVPVKRGAVPVQRPVLPQDTAEFASSSHVARSEMSSQTAAALPGRASTDRQDEAVATRSPLQSRAVAPPDLPDHPMPEAAAGGGETQQGMLSAVLRASITEPSRDRDHGRRSGMSTGSTREPAAGFSMDGLPSAMPAGVVAIKIYLPSKQSLKLRIPDSATFADVIAEILRYTRTANVSPALAGDARCYELRLHDEDGEPDDDFPALDRTRKIRNFGQGGAHEYCLRAIPSAMAAYNAQQSAAAAAAAGIGPRPGAVAPTALALTGAAGAPAANAADMRMAPVRDDGTPGRKREPVGFAVPGDAGRTGDHSASALTSPASSLSSTSALTTAQQPPPSLRVVMHSAAHPTPTVTMVPFREDLRVQDVIEYVAKRHRLPVFHERYVLKVSHVDQVRLNLPTRELPNAALVLPLALDTVEIVKKTYADSPPDRAAATASAAYRRGDVAVGRPSRLSAITTEAGARDGAHGSASTPGGSASGSTPGAFPTTATGAAPGGPLAGTLGGTATGAAAGGSVASSGLARPLVQPGMGPAGLMHNAITAAQFQEWYVIKVNKRGRRQERLMGIDLTRITNRKVEKKRFVSEKTVNAERLISDIRRVEISDSNKTSFTITFRENESEDVSLTYETRTAFEREEITSKITFILNLNGQGYRVVRVP